jgi:hypothetical protein
MVQWRHEPQEDGVTTHTFRIVVEPDEDRWRAYAPALARISHRAAADVGFSDVSGCLSGFWGREPGVLSLSGRG